jgi:hypothetical protein
MNKRVIIYSHGFGVDKTDKGLFTDISLAFPNEENIMFDYSVVDKINNTVTVSSLTDEAKKLGDIVRTTRRNNPKADIDLICHSQGCNVAAILQPNGIRNIILLAPPIELGNQLMIDVFSKHSGAIVDFDGITIFSRPDGRKIIIPAKYWASRLDIDTIKLINELSNIAKVTIINANQDELLGFKDFSGLDPKNKLINIDGTHNFVGEARFKLIDTIKGILV